MNDEYSTGEFRDFLAAQIERARLRQPQDKGAIALAMTKRSAKATKIDLPLTRGGQLFQGQNNVKKQKKIVRMEQWVEVRIRDGRTVTRLYPPNEQLIKEGQAMLPPPEFVYRRLNFPDGVPPEYDWTGIPEAQRERGGCGIQRMTVDTWLDVIEREKLREDGHIGKTGIGNLPRPKEHGECGCPVCTKNKGMWEKLGLSA